MKDASNKVKEKIFTCRYCGNKTAHNLIYSHVVDVPISVYGEEDIYAPDYFFLLECKTCNGVSLKEVFSEELDFPNTEINFENIHYLYPASRTLGKDVPEGLSMVMKEANKVKLVSPMAYLVLIRKVLEELCKDRGINEGRLKDGLSKLVESENLPKVFADSTEKLRLLGNLGAHESKIEINSSEIALVEDFVIALIEHIYIVPSKLRKLDNALKKQTTKK